MLGAILSGATMAGFWTAMVQNLISPAQTLIIIISNSSHCRRRSSIHPKFPEEVTTLKHNIKTHLVVQFNFSLLRQGGFVNFCRE